MEKEEEDKKQMEECSPAGGDENGPEGGWSDGENECNDDSDESDGDESVSGVSTGGNGDGSGISSDESDGGSEKCAICLQRFQGQEIGSPETCEHHFCLKCITEWSKKVATCPVDRKTFPAILVKKEIFGAVVRIVDVEVENVGSTSLLDEYDTDPTYCEVCGHCDREDRLLLCDGCDLGFHMECLEPPMEYVPIEDWFCPACQTQRRASEEAAQRPSRRQLRLPRTGQSRRLLESIRQSARRESSTAGEGSQSSSRRRTTTRTPSRRTKRRKTAKGAGRRSKRKTRKGRKKNRVAIQRRPVTARGRLAVQLGILPPRPGQVYVGLPRCRTPVSQSTQSSTSSSSLRNLRYQAGITPLRIYSTSEDLADCMESFSDEEGSVGVARMQPIHRIGFPIKPGMPSSRSHVVEIPQPSSSSDILGPILSNQIIMLTDRNIQIKRDGTLVPSISVKPSSISPLQPSRRNSVNNEISDSVFNPVDKSVPAKANGYIPSLPSSSKPSLTASDTAARQVPTSPATTNENNSAGSYNSGNSSGNNNNRSENPSSQHRESDSASASGNVNSSWNSNSANSNWYLQNNTAPCGPRNDDPNGAKAYESYLYSSSIPPKPNSERRKSCEENSENNNAEDDEEYNIYSDIEEDAVPENDSKQANANETENDPATGCKDKDSDDDMVIVEDEVEGIKPRQRDSRSSAESPSKVDVSDDVRSTEDSRVPPDVPFGGFPNMPSPASIPLPDSPPPSGAVVGADDEDDENARSDVSSPDIQDSRRNGHKSHGRAVEEYDPSQPLTSSDEEEHSIKLTQRSSSRRTPEKSPQKHPPKRPGRVSSNKEAREKLEDTPIALDLSSIPLPSDDHGKSHDDNRVRPTIQFSIPTRHKLLSISSLMKRQKGVAKKESKNALSFSSEISKAFGEDKQDESDEENEKSDEPKVSLVAEIFGSDDEEEKINNADNDSSSSAAGGLVADKPVEPALLPGKIPLLPPAPNPVPAVLPDLVEQVQPAPVLPPVVSAAEKSSMWRQIVTEDTSTVAESQPDTPPLEDAPIAQPPLVEDEDSNDSIAVLETVQKSNKTTEDDDIQVVGFTPAKEKRAKELPKKQPSTEKEKGSQLESISEGDSEFERQSRRGDGSAAESKRKSRRDRVKEKPKDNKERKTSRRRRSQSSVSNREEGEIVDSPEKRRKKRKDKKKAKKRKRSKNGKTAIDFSEKKITDVSTSLRHSSEEENMGDSVVAWRKPSNSAKERNYRDGKPKPEEKFFKTREKKRDPSPRDRHDKQREKSPAVGKDKSFRERNDSGRSRKRSLSPKSRSRSFSRSRFGRKPRSRSDRSTSSNRSLRSRSRSPSFRRRKRGRYSLSPRRSRSVSRSPLKPRSRSPLRRRSRNRKRSSSPGRPRRLKSRKRSASSSSSVSSKRNKRKRKEKPVAVPDKIKKKKDKERERVPEPRELKEKEKEKDKEREKEKDKEKKKRKKRREKSVSPAKEIFADGDSIVVSLNFQKGTSASAPVGSNSKDSTSPPKIDSDGDKKKSRGRSSRRGRSSEKDASGKPRLLKKTLLIDLETSPVQEQNIGVSPTLIVLSDDEDKEQGQRKDVEPKTKDVLQDGASVSTSSADGQHDVNSPYRHGVVADSTQIQHPNQSDSKMDSSSIGASTPPYDNSNLSPARDDSIVTSTRDAEAGLPPEEDSRSPSLSPPSKPSEAMHQPHSPAGSPPPLPPDSPPHTGHDSRNESCGTPASSVSSHLSSQAALGGSGKPLIGNIPGLFPSANTVGAATGPVSVPPPILIPTPPTAQMRIPTSVSQSLLAPNVLASVATALYGPLLAARQQQQQQASTPSGKFSTPTGNVGSMSGSKSSSQGSVLLPKNQNSHGSGGSRSKGNGSGGGDGDSPFSPNSSDGDDLFEPPLDRSQADNGPSKSEKSQPGQPSGSLASNATAGCGNSSAGVAKTRDKAGLFDSLFGGTSQPKKSAGGHHKSHDKPVKIKPTAPHQKSKSKRGAKKEIPKLSEGELRLTEDVPTSAVELRVKEKFLKKLNRQERVVEEVKLSLKPHYSKKHVTKDEYKEILRRAVPKICHNKSGEINPYKIKELVEAYVKKFRHSRKKDGSGGGGGGVNLGSS